MPVSPQELCCFLLIVDLATRFISVAVLSNQKVGTLKQVLWDKWFSIFSIPLKLRSDQGANVNSNVIIYGANPKIAVSWMRRLCTIDKKMGPSTYAIKGPKGGIKFFRHNNLMPAMI